MWKKLEKELLVEKEVDPMTVNEVKKALTGKRSKYRIKRAFRILSHMLLKPMVCILDIKEIGDSINKICSKDRECVKGIVSSLLHILYLACGKPHRAISVLGNFKYNYIQLVRQLRLHLIVAPAYLTISPTFDEFKNELLIHYLLYKLHKYGHTLGNRERKIFLITGFTSPIISEAHKIVYPRGMVLGIVGDMQDIVIKRSSNVIRGLELVFTGSASPITLSFTFGYPEALHSIEVLLIR